VCIYVQINETTTKTKNGNHHSSNRNSNGDIEVMESCVNCRKLRKQLESTRQEMEEKLRERNQRVQQV